MDLDLLHDACTARKLPAFRQRQIRAALMSGQAGSWDEVTTLPVSLRAQFEDEVPFSTVTVDHEERSSDGSIKLRLLSTDGHPFEAVLMRFDQPHARPGQRTSRYTACLSSQSGCALACTFCATGAMGLGRNLSTWEIVDQFLELSRRRREAVAEAGGDPTEGRIDNVVMMGMGEPFHNYDNVIEALKILNSPDGVGLAARRIAISTVGWIPGIDRLTDEPTQFKLALSLHAPNDELRSSLMPVNKRYPIADLMAACRRYRAATRRRIFIEYLMLDGINDQPEHARELGLLLGNVGFHVNLIAYNPTGTDYIGSSDATVRKFASVLEGRGIEASYRVSRARDISGACGQLAAPLAAVQRAKREARLARSKAIDAGEPVGVS